jgi:hypothetical protein
MNRAVEGRSRQQVAALRYGAGRIVQNAGRVVQNIEQPIQVACLNHPRIVR